MRRPLSDVPSELILEALEDLEKCEADKQYKIDMAIWHSHMDDDGKCHVCLAGAAMAQSLKLSPLRTVWFTALDRNLQRHAMALSRFRSGMIKAGLSSLGIRKHSFPAKIPITPYEESPEQFKADMRDLAQSFQDAGM